jgi:hypothetical protein
MQPPRTTSIENFLDLNEIMGNGGNGMAVSSVEGYPPMPGVNSNFVQQMSTENYERDTAMKPLASRIRNTNPEQLQLAMNGGVRETYTDFQLGPVARQNLSGGKAGAGLPIQEPYEEAPKPYQQHPSLPKNSAQYSNYAESFVMPVGPQFNCMDVAHHIQKCPLCSKFYDNDKSIFWAAIVLLAIACIYLLKRVMDCKK